MKLSANNPLFHEIAFAVLRMVAQAVANGDRDTLQQTRMPLKEAIEINNMPLVQLDHLTRLSASFMEIGLDGHSLSLMVPISEERCRTELMGDKLIQAEAPWPLLHEMFGISEAGFSRRRKFFGLGCIGAGRSALPTDAQQQQLWAAWKQAGDRPLPEKLLRVYDETRIPLNTAWFFLKTLLEEPEPKTARGGA